MGACYCWRASLLHRHALCNIHLAAIPISMARRKSLDNREDGYGTGVFNFYSSRWFYAEEFQLRFRKIATARKQLPLPHKQLPLVSGNSLFQR